MLLGSQLILNGKVIIHRKYIPPVPSPILFVLLTEEALTAALANARSRREAATHVNLQQFLRNLQTYQPASDQKIITSKIKKFAQTIGLHLSWHTHHQRGGRREVLNKAQNVSN